MPSLVTDPTDMIALFDLLITATLPIFAISAVGFVMARRGHFSVAQAEGVNAFVMRVAVPALMFRLLYGADLGGFDWAVLGLYATAEITVYAATFALCRFLLGVETREALLLGMAAIFVNGVFFVLPIAGLLYGPEAEQVITGIVVIDSTLLFGGTILLMDLLERREGGAMKLLATFSSNPAIIAMVAGLGVNLIGLAVPTGILTYVGFVGEAASPAALFALGVILANAGLAEGRRVVPVVIGMKMLGQPLVTFALLTLVVSPGFWPQDLASLGFWGQTALLFTAGPAGAMPFVIALSYGIRTERIALVVIATTVISLIALPGAALLGG